MTSQAVVGLIVIVLTVGAILRRVEVRLALSLGGLALGFVAGRPWEAVATWISSGDSAALAPLVDGPARVLRTFLATMADEKFVVPICCAMGFATVLRHTGCDQHLVRLLVRPLRRVRFLLVPGSVVVGFLVNIPVISQTSTAATVGPVLIPLLQSAGVSPVTAGAALLLGSSVGGELLNPGAPELRSVTEKTEEAARHLGMPPVGLQTADCVRRVLPLNVVQLITTTVVFWLFSLRDRSAPPTPAETPEPDLPVNLLKAAVPLVPLVLLFLTTPTFNVLPIPKSWLVADPASLTEMAKFDSRLIGVAMLIGAVVATLVAGKPPSSVAAAFFEGTGYAFAHIISLIVAASAFGEGVRQIGLAGELGKLILASPVLLLPLAGLVSLGFAVTCGSGMATTQSLFEFFAAPALQLGIDPAHVGAVVSLAAAVGRSTSPWSAVALLCAQLTETSPIDLVKRLAIPGLVGVAAMVAAAMLLS